MTTIVGKVTKIVQDVRQLDLNKKMSFYLPKVGSGYASATVQNVLNMNINNKAGATGVGANDLDNG